ncbi:MAG: glutamate synthase large subunit, partial [Clostridia bacterium]
MERKTLYSKQFEHDACGIGAVVSIDGVQSHKVVSDALTIVEKLEHRAGKDATGEVGDGVGIMVQISHNFFSKVVKNFEIGEERDYGVGMFFFPSNEKACEDAKIVFEEIVKENDAEFLGWREVPTNPAILGKKALDAKPSILQAFIKRPENLSQGLDFDRLLYIIRRHFEKKVEGAYVPSLSSRTIVYKGMFLVEQLREFYLDLKDEEYISSMAMVHSRFSTNTNPSWQAAHPNRVILHNGEINTIRGNADRMLSRESSIKSKVLSDVEMKSVFPIISGGTSDSAMLDNTLEFLYMNKMPLPLAVMLTIPEPWQKNTSISQLKRDFYQYNATMIEPWDGPAAILFADGDIMGATLDRNGLRPSRYYITTDNMLILSSEVGVLDIPVEKVVTKSRLEPGKILIVDTVAKKVIADDECKNDYATRKPYGEWLRKGLLSMSDINIYRAKSEKYTAFERQTLYKAFGYNYEDIKGIILPMAENGIEPTAAMGTDVPLAVLARTHQPLFKYFKQLFAQVTNPPIDSLREKIVTDTTIYIGSDGNLLNHTEDNCVVFEVANPIIQENEMHKIKSLNRPGLCAKTISILYDKSKNLEQAVEDLYETIDKAFDDGFNIFILSDRGVTEDTKTIPSLLAVSAVKQHLIRNKRYTFSSIVLESGEPRDVHQFATLIGYGASAIFPYLAHECIADLIETNVLTKDYKDAIADYNNAVINGIVKISAKMGISCIQSYHSSQIFEAIGLNQKVVDKYFTNTFTPVSGIGLDEIEKIYNAYHEKAFESDEVENAFDSVGFASMRKDDQKESHLYNRETMVKLQQSTREGDYAKYKEYANMVNDEHKPHTLRALLDFDTSAKISIDEVEPACEIVKRFKTGAMSYGSISIEAHECMAIAMNTLGAKSNSGEGGERPDRFKTIKNSAIKQVASGRFGVTSEYLLSAKEIQIKLAQGAKPGEGGHLPSQKVYPWIATTRHSTPGVTLISPPPHHDIYSIEDLAQLVYDLKNANQDALISVKLVSEAGVGTVAAGVAKSGAGLILISGYDGGTGAAPQSSINDTGLPWELGLAETHQTLIKNGLRDSVVIETDGKLMTGRDIAIATLLGAEEFGFASAPLVTMGCMMLRVCNLDTCPFGIATQNEKLRARFKGKPEYVINYMMFVAEELREIMADLGFRTVEEMVGQSHKLKPRANIAENKYADIDLSAIIQFVGEENTTFNHEKLFDFKLEETLDNRVILKEFEDALENGTKHAIDIDVTSTDRTLGTIFGSKVTQKFGTSLPEDTFTINCTGGAGQSFGAFLPKGVTLNLYGDSNDYIGKGLSGGKIVVTPPSGSVFKASENVIIGNVAFYGATLP